MIRAQHGQPQPTELSTGERLSTTGRSVAQGWQHRLNVKHETQRGADLTVDPADIRAAI